ncbi:MAG: DNA repair protein RecO [Bacteroidales bacterium]|nr:DNA repair protein RecO [Bacteroidales bacterium]MCF8454668.1 DNA repair protein RecO [Bacteroidales bacterium]
MSLHKTKGIVLHYIKYGETSIIATIYTQKFGRQAYIIKGARSPKSRLKANLFQPLFLIDMEVYHKPGRELQMIKEVKNTTPFVDIPFNLKKSSVCLFLAEVLYRTLREEEQSPKLFEFISENILFFDKAEKFLPNFHLTFLLHLSRFLGFYPHNDYTETNCLFDLKEGHFIGFKPAHKYFLPKQASFEFHALMETGFSDELKFSASEMRQFLLDKILEFYHFHLEHIGEIKSIEVLREVFRDE